MSSIAAKTATESAGPLTGRVALVTGASGGIGAALAKMLAAEGARVVLAGFAIWKSLEATSLAEWDHIFAVNVRAAAYLCASVLPDMQQRGYGRIINIGSEAGVAIVPGFAAYCVSKHALRALTEVIQDGNHSAGIKAWVVCPGFVDTDMGYVVPGAIRTNFLRVEEVVEVVRYLLHTPDNVKLGPEILIRTMRNPMSG